MEEEESNERRKKKMDSYETIGDNKVDAVAPFNDSSNLSKMTKCTKND
jgi:hypothetical protein